MVIFRIIDVKKRITGSKLKEDNNLKKDYLT